MTNKPLSFTTKWPHITNVLLCPISIKIPDTEPTIKCNSIWDTGATGCVITQNMAAQLGLVVIGQTMISGVHGPMMRNTYVIDIVLQNGIVFSKVPVTECHDLMAPDINCHMLIGMNIITAGDLAITNHDGKTCMTFRIPPTKHIDFVREDNARLAVEAKHSGKRR